MKREVQLYISDTRVDLFKDETISLTDTIQNVRDISKVFATFTKTFTLPASSTNNKLFKHYYNFNIRNASDTSQSAFDARKKVTARIEINLVPFKDGKIKLEGVDMKNNQPYAYRVTFFGNTVDIKDVLGEDKLSALTDLSSLNKDYDAGTLKTYLTTNPSSSDIIVPLITHTQRLYFDSGETTSDTGNLATTSNTHGVRFDNLKYAIRVHNIIEAIQSQYADITFSSDFFTETSNDQYSKLFMWCHRKKGNVESGSQVTDYPNLATGWSAGAGTGGSSILSNQNTLRITEDNQTFGTAFTFYLNEASGSGTYDLLIERNGSSYYNQNGITGDTTINLYSLNGSQVEQGDYTVTITVTSAVTFTALVWTVTSQEPSEAAITDAYSTGFTAAATFEFNVPQQLPDIKVIDFLAGLFKMFNLTAFVNNTGTMVVKTLDSYYSGGATYDITEHVNIEQSQVNVALPFKQIDFGYEETETFFAAIHDQLFGQQWGTIKWNEQDSNLDGSVYKVELPFEHQKYERLIDIDDSSSTTIQWGWSVDDNQDSYIGKPLLFYPIYNSMSANNISYISAINADQTFQTEETISGSINIPSNAVALASGTSTANINFNNEPNEYTGDETFTGTLFSNYYSSYISTVFDGRNRLTKVKAKLPMNILLNYTLADKFRIGGTAYRINSITTNLTTGEADIELLNIT